MWYLVGVAGVVFLVGLISGVLVGGRLKSPQIWAFGFLVGVFAGLAVGVKIIIGGVYGRRGKSGKGEGSRRGSLLVGLRGDLGGADGSEWETLFSVLQVRGANLCPGRKGDGSDKVEVQGRFGKQAKVGGG